MEVKKSLKLFLKKYTNKYLLYIILTITIKNVFETYGTLVSKGIFGLVAETSLTYSGGFNFIKINRVGQCIHTNCEIKPF